MFRRCRHLTSTSLGWSKTSQGVVRGGEGDKSIRVDQPPHLEVFERGQGGYHIDIAVACQTAHMKVSERGQ